MSYLITVTHPWHQASVSTEYAPKEYEANTPEEAAQVFQREANPVRLDLSRAVGRLYDGFELRHQDRETGRTVVACPEPTHMVVVTHPRAEDDRDDREFPVGSIERAAEIFEGECPDYDFETALEDLERNGRIEDVDEETGRVVVALELVPAGVV